jgi:amino acid adenylation domain-containing protein
VIKILPGMSVKSLAQEITSGMFRVLRHQRYRAEALRRDLNLSATRTLLYRTHVNYLSFDYQVKFGKGRATVCNRSTGDVDDVNFEFYDREDGNGVSIQLKFQSELYSAEEASTHSRRFGILLDTISRSIEQAIATVAMLSAEERELVLQGWNDTAAEYPRELCVHQLFEQQVERTPDATALIFEEQTLTYAELNQQANQLAHHLRTFALQPDDRVALCLERGFPMVVAILAVLKAGAAYLPLDPAYPGDRLDFMLHDAQPRLLLTQASLAELFAARDTPVLLLDRQAHLRQQASALNISPSALALTPHHVAYVIYTSGSTGQPKGVMVEHRQLSARLTGVRTYLGFNTGDVMPIVSSAAFDISLLETLLPLVSGGATRITDARRIKDMDYLIEHTRSCSVFNAVTSLMQAWLYAVAKKRATGTHPALRSLLVGGEPVSQQLINQLASVFPDAQIVETYGPTEATLFCTACIASSNPDITALPPIGRPIANTRIYILDTHGQPAPIGVAGEIYIGGESIARGYLNRPELTSQRFLKDPFSTSPNARMYKTGDLGRWLPDGNIQFLGRNDFQVKIRGFRIELGEIEARLIAHPSVQDAVVLAREDQPGDKRLVAYVVPRNQAQIEAETLREHLASALPEYMIPVAYVSLDALPLSPNGKLDRQALPAPGIEAFSTTVFQEPQGETEILLAGLWQELLHIDRVGRFDNFFQLGGHSLLAISLIERMRQAGLQADIRSLFQAPTLAQLAASLRPHDQLSIPESAQHDTLASEEIELSI